MSNEVFKDASKMSGGRESDDAKSLSRASLSVSKTLRR